MCRFTLIVLAVFSITRIAGAHPGHGESGGGFSLMHHLSEPVHILGAVILVSLVVAASRIVRRRMRS